MTWIRLKVQNEQCFTLLLMGILWVLSLLKRIELGCDMNKTNSDGLAPLHHVAIQGHVGVVDICTH